MKMKTKKTLLITALLTISTLIFGSDKILLCGSGWPSIGQLDRVANKLDWEFKVEEAAEMNSICLTKDGNIAVSTKKGLVVLDRKTRETIWSYKAEGNNEVHSVTLLPNGNLLVGECAVPSRILEMDNSGKIVNEINFDSGSKSIHPQFRQISINKNGDYIVPLYGGKAFLEISKEGKLLKKVPAPIRLFSSLVLKNGNYLLSGEAADKADREKVGPRIVEYSPTEGKIVREINSDVVDGAKLLFIAQIRELDNGNLLICNFNGHSRDRTQPKLFEVDKDWNLVWKIDAKAPMKNLTGTFLLN